MVVVAVFFIVYGSCCSPVACSTAPQLWSHRMEIARGLGNTKTKTLDLLKEFMGQTMASSAATTLGRFLHFYIELWSVGWAGAG